MSSNKKHNQLFHLNLSASLAYFQHSNSGPLRIFLVTPLEQYLML